jgi:DNA-binding CsgD family transcriptional regulator
MGKTPETIKASDGFLLLDADHNPLFVNPAAMQILLYPQKITANKQLGASLAAKIRFTLLAVTPKGASGIVSKLQSGRRLYLCRSYRVNPVTNADTPLSVAVLLERNSGKSTSLTEISEKFHLTTREQEVSQHLLSGLTTKEIASRMKISPHTVKTFLRLIMVKMGVSTRSGILGKAFTTEPEFRSASAERTGAKSLAAWPRIGS